jgi:hypothetical protein
MINQRVLNAQQLAQQDGENPTVELSLRGQNCVGVLLSATPKPLSSNF